MKKQGPPAPLTNAKLEMLKKRKAGGDTAESKAEAGPKRRRADIDEEELPKKKISGAALANGKSPFIFLEGVAALEVCKQLFEGVE